MLVLPGAIAGLIGLHLYLVVRLGVSVAAVVARGRRTEPQPGPPPAPREGLVAPAPRGARRSDEQAARGAARRARALQGGRQGRAGSRSSRIAMFHDTVMSLLVVCVIVALAVHLEVHDAGRGIRARRAGSGKLYDEKADPGTTNFVPRPDWYFYFLFYLLRIFKWPESVILGTVIVPTIAMVLLLALPFIDVGAERRPLRRPVAMVAAMLTIISMGALTYKGAAAKEALGVRERSRMVPRGRRSRGFTDNTEAVEGAKIFAQVGCMNCHTYLGAGTLEPRRAGSVVDRQDVEPRRRRASPTYVAEPVEVRQQRRCRSSPTSGRTTCAGSARSSSRPARVVRSRELPRCGRAVVRVFLGITGASGAPYAARLVDSLAAGRVRGRAVRLGGRGPGARDRAVRRPAPAARRGAGALHRAAPATR